MIEYGQFKYMNAKTELIKKQLKNDQYKSILNKVLLDNKSIDNELKDIISSEYRTVIEKRVLTKSQNKYNNNISYCRFLERKISSTT